jgi:hypothetical protein
MRLDEAVVDADLRAQRLQALDVLIHRPRTLGLCCVAVPLM